MAQKISKKKISKKDAQKKIGDFFNNSEDKNPKEIQKIKRFAMKYNLKLGGKRKSFCKKCFKIYKNPTIRIRNNMKSIICENCGYASRWKIKKSN